MRVKELIELLNNLSDHEKEMSPVFQDKKYGLYAIGGIWIREKEDLVVLVSRDDPPKGSVQAIRERGAIKDEES